MIALNGRLFDGAILAFDLTLVRPRPTPLRAGRLPMPALCEAIVDFGTVEVRKEMIGIWPALWQFDSSMRKDSKLLLDTFAKS